VPPASSTASKLAALVKLFPGTFVDGVRQRDLFREVEALCLFVGYPRSGHTLVGSFLDAHPDAVIAHELDVLRFVYARFLRRQIYAMALANARAAVSRARRAGGYSYAVPGQWQGRFRSIKVIGDKHAESTSVRLHDSPWLLNRLPIGPRQRLRLVHVIRNPYDNIAAIARRIREIAPHLLSARRGPLPDAVDYYFTLCKTVAWVRNERPGDVLDVRHETFVADPRYQLDRLCRFVGLAASDEYLQACASVVFESPRRTRMSVEWPPALIHEVADRMRAFPFLEGYTFEQA